MFLLFELLRLSAVEKEKYIVCAVLGAPLTSFLFSNEPRADFSPLELYIQESYFFDRIGSPLGIVILVQKTGADAFKIIRVLK